MGNEIVKGKLELTKFSNDNQKSWRVVKEDYWDTYLKEKMNHPYSISIGFVLNPIIKMQMKNYGLIKIFDEVWLEYLPKIEMTGPLDRLDRFIGLANCLERYGNSIAQFTRRIDSLNMDREQKEAIRKFNRDFYEGVRGFTQLRTYLNAMFRMDLSNEEILKSNFPIHVRS